MRIRTAERVRQLLPRGGNRVGDALVRSGLVDALPAYWFRRVSNLGDALARVVLEHVHGARPVWVSEQYAGKALSTGSVLETLRPGDVVWGAGAITDAAITVPEVEYLAVRGPLTRSRIEVGDVPEVYGDPAMLLPRLYSPERPAEPVPVGVIPHYVDRDVMASDGPSVVVIDVTRPWREVVDLIAGCEVVVSSSLHGIVVAEAYGVPSAWVTAGDRVIGGEFKFNDYYLSTGRSERRPGDWAQGLDAAVRQVAEPGGTDLDALVTAWQQRDRRE